ncbi:MAG: hypothetical protein ACREJ6_02975 [Candidatus Methylomirabilis sp.]
MSLTRMVCGIMTMALVVLLAGGSAMAQAPAGEKQSVPGGGVTVDVTLLNEGPGGGPTFKVVLDTHSVNLDAYKFEEIVRLRDGRGGGLAPTAVEGAEGSGHHREATVRFAWPDPKPKSLELVVKGVAGVPERAFQWALE